MKYKAILFDLDGTLLPMDNDEFTKGYFGLLYRDIAPLGYGKEEFVKAMWSGVAAMVKNTTDRINSERFWEVFSELLGEKILEHKETINAFYEGEFKKAIAFTQPTPLAREAVRLAAEKAEKVVLATNPFFPPVAVKARLEWAGLKWEDFDHITHYDNSKRCKPNPDYFIEVAHCVETAPSDCLMIGNNTREDIAAAQVVGMDTYLVTDCLISEGDMPETKKGTFEDLIEYLKSI